MIAHHHPRCILRMVAEEGPDDGEAIARFEWRLARMRCTCRDAMALELAPKLRPFIGQKLTEELQHEIKIAVRMYAEDLEREGWVMRAPTYRLDWHSNGVRVVWDRIDDRDRSDTDG